MGVKVTDNHPLIKIKHDRGVNLSLRMAMDDIDREAFSKTPKDKGELRKNLKKQVSGKRGTIEWTSNYAAYQERGYSSGPIRNYTTSGTGAHFAENAVRKVSSKYPDVYFKAVKL